MPSASEDVQILCAKGGLALSGFKTNQLLSTIRQATGLDVENLHASYCYFLHSRQSADLQQNIDAVLDIVEGALIPASELFSAHCILVVPRLGTTSPWSTKATEILRRCGFDTVERIERGTLWTVDFEHHQGIEHKKPQLLSSLYDRMTETCLQHENQITSLFKLGDVKEPVIIDVMADGLEALRIANQQMGLALSESELEYLHDWFATKHRNPTETELMTFSQVNSEHCRHKIFNAKWIFDGVEKSRSMFSMIRETHRQNNTGTLVAYEDNAAVIAGRGAELFVPTDQANSYGYVRQEQAHVIFKAETHNHPTAISPFPGAATGAGGEIRDEGATGIGGKPKAGICGFSVSHLRIPDYLQPWELPENRPNRIASPLNIMLEGPIGAASFNNEFGRPNIGGYFRTFEVRGDHPEASYGFHKPIMFAGGIGNIRPQHIHKRQLSDGDVLIVLGGPSMLIGLGGGAASSLEQGRSDEALDFSSVQRSNPEMQRRCQETIDRCRELGEANPILSIHDVGAGGLSNALPEIVHAAGFGGTIQLHDIPVDDSSMSPMEIWCNEAQERYVLVISGANVAQFAEICVRENCPWKVIGEVTTGNQFTVQARSEQTPVVDVNLDFLLGEMPQTTRTAKSANNIKDWTVRQHWDFADCVERVLRYPSVADKSFLINIGDRTVSGLIHRDQMVGPWQVPVADAAVTISGYKSHCGEAMAIGERSPIAVIDAVASARMAVGESLTNLRSTGISSLSDVRLCANWMASAGVEGEVHNLYESVRSVAMGMCLELGISIPVGKDSLSMSTEWAIDDERDYHVFSPVSLVATAFASLDDVRRSVTPQLHQDLDTVILLVDLGFAQNRMGMSVLHQSHNCVSGPVPDVDDVSILKRFFNALGELIFNDWILAYHDRSDGGLFCALCEMAFAGKVGLDIEVDETVDSISYFFNEELGAVIQVKRQMVDTVLQVFDRFDIAASVSLIGKITKQNQISLKIQEQSIYSAPLNELHRVWSELTYKMQSLRDNPACAQQEYDQILEFDDPGLSFDGRVFDQVRSTLKSSDQVDFPSISTGKRPTVAILREQGVNGHFEMAAAFDQAGFEAVDVVMLDLVSGNKTLEKFSGVALCGGFSFGDVFGAGRGWANLILHQNSLRDQFATYFENTSKFVFGVCNGCQVLSSLKEIIPGAHNWPSFVRNQSEQFEARLVMTKVNDDRSILTRGMQGMALPIAVAHGEGRAKFHNESDFESLKDNRMICLQYADHRMQETTVYPHNPNGSYGAVAGVTNSDGRITAMMPHPERVFRMIQYSWSGNSSEEFSPWLNLFLNARKWVA